jgi:soluble lytic murein transglycosylase-like protein
MLALRWVSVLATTFAAQVCASTAVEPPVWNDEPPTLSRWIEQGYAAQQQADIAKAAVHYCAAARFGSTEAQYRLGHIFLAIDDEQKQREGLTMLALAAQRGHALAAQAIEGRTHLDVLPDCLLTGQPPALVIKPAVEPPVPVEVVERYVQALPGDKRQHAHLIRRLAPRFGVDFRLALAIARAESNLDAKAVSPKNAQGLMQLIPDTAQRFGVRNAFDPEQNIRGGLAYLRWLLDRFDGSVELASAAYNAGEGTVDRYGGVPPYSETREYVQRILHFYRSPVHVKPGML